MLEMNGDWVRIFSGLQWNIRRTIAIHKVDNRTMAPVFSKIRILPIKEGSFKNRKFLNQMSLCSL